MPYGITYMWNLKYETNEPIYEIESETQRTTASAGGCRSGGDVREGWSGSLGLTDANYYTEDG